jgi:hypothetical protein
MGLLREVGEVWAAKKVGPADPEDAANLAV